MAERQNTMILHMTLNFLHYYLVQGNSAIYRYMFSTGKRGVSEKEPIGQEVIQYIANSAEYIQDDPRPLRQEVTGTVANAEQVSAEKIHPEDTEILRRIIL
jgi:hypothetical protein